MTIDPKTGQKFLPSGRQILIGPHENPCEVARRINGMGMWTVKGEDGVTRYMRAGHYCYPHGFELLEESGSFYAVYPS